MLFGNAPAQKLYCVSVSDDLLAILRNVDLSNLQTFDYERQQGHWSKKDSSAIFGIAAKKLGSACLFGTWMSRKQTLKPIIFSGIDGYVIGQLNDKYLAASSIALTTSLKTGVFI